MGIGTLSEKSLHAALKAWYSKPGDRTEVPVDGYIVDVVRGGDLIEIQTGNFASIKRKLAHLLRNHAVRLVHPVPSERWVSRLGADGRFIGRRRSPKKCDAFDVFRELVRIPHLLLNPNLTIEVLLVREEVVYADDGGGSRRRRGMRVVDRRLIMVEGSVVLSRLADFTELLPRGLPTLFTVKDITSSKRCTVALARMAAYTLVHMGALETAGVRGNAKVYKVAPGNRFLFDPMSREMEEQA